MTTPQSIIAEDKPADPIADKTALASRRELQPSFKPLSQVLPLYSAREDKGRDEGLYPLMALPFQIFSMMLTPWTAFMPQAKSASGSFKRPSLRAENVENDKEYIYRIELPENVMREQVALNIQNGMIMLRIEPAEDKRTSDSYYKPRAIRRAFSLPIYSDSGALKASMQGGVLTIIIPKAERRSRPSARSIEIE